MAFTISGIGNYSGITFTTTQPPPPPIGLFSWGYNTNGNLGLGDSTALNARSSPVQVGALTDWLQIAAGGYHTMAIKSNGGLWAWGQGGSGRLGLSDGTSRSSPVQVGALTNWSMVVAALYGNHTIAVKTDGTLWTWGDAEYGKLGHGNATAYSSPKQVGASTNWLRASAGYRHSLAIGTNGTLWAWGSNYYGNLGLTQRGPGVDRNSPVQVGSLTNWATVEASRNRSFAIKTDGTLWAWGGGSSGVLGLGSDPSLGPNSPVQVGALTNWLRVSSGSYGHAAAIKTDGTLWTWGYGPLGQLGLGNSTSYSSPKQVGALTNWSKVSTGVYHCVVAKTDGTLWTWGYGSAGQLGLGDTTARSSPVQVGSLTTWANVSAGNYFTMAISS